MYRIVPLPMEFITDDVDLSQLLVRDFGSSGVFVGVKLAFDSQTCAGCHRSNKIDDHCMADKRFTSPILADIGKDPIWNVSTILRHRVRRISEDCLAGIVV